MRVRAVMPVVVLESGTSFSAEAGVPILDAATQAHVALPYSCKTGRCSTCKCKVTSGRTTALYPESGLTEKEKAEGWILSCVRTADTDVVVEVDDLIGIDLPTVKTWPCKINHIERLAPDVIQVLLRLPPSAEFNFIPGQYVDAIGPNGIRRSYSLANASFIEKVLELHIRSVEGGSMSNYWFNQAKVGDLLRINGPLGTFFLRDSSNLDLYFLATGTGIAPIKAMLESIGREEQVKTQNSVTVFWGGRHSEDFYWEIASIPGNHTFIPVHSRPDKKWSGATGYVQDVLLDLGHDMKSAAVYACGSDAMIRSAKTRLVDAGLSPKRFYSDAFVRSGRD